MKLLFLLLVFYVGFNIHPNKDTEKISYSISLNKKQYKIGEEIIVISELRNKSDSLKTIELKPETQVVFYDNHMPIPFYIVKIKIKTSYKKMLPHSYLKRISFLGKTGYRSYKSLSIGKYYIYSIYGFQGDLKSNIVKFEVRN